MLSLLVTPDASALGSGTYRLAVAIQESDAFLEQRWVSGSVDWGDGTALDEVPKQAITAGDTTPTYSLGHRVPPGSLVVKVRARNYRAPQPDTALTVLFVTRQALPAGEQASRPTMAGMILPRDRGFPGPDQWSFSTGVDLQVVESAVKLLLSTAKGERLMEPAFGTRLRSIIFEPDTPAVDSLIQAEISGAIEAYAPFVQVTGLRVLRGPKAARVELSLVSKAMQQGLQVGATFQR